MLNRNHKRLGESADLPRHVISNVNGIKNLCDRILSRSMGQEDLFNHAVEIAIQSIRLAGNVDVDEIPQSRLEELVASAREDIYDSIAEYI